MARIDAAHEVIQKISDESKAAGREKLSDADQKDVNYAHKRINELNLSRRIVFNRNWVFERVERDLAIYKQQVKEAKTQTEKMQAEQKIILLTRTLNCQHCHGYGDVGMDIQRGYPKLCGCVTKNIHLFG